MTDRLLVMLIVICTAGLAAILATRTVLAERAAGTGTVPGAPATRPPLVRRLDTAGVVITVLLFAVVVIRVVNTVA
jgi:predicted secreted protein